MLLKIYGITLCIFFAIDLVWLTLIAKNFYNKHIGFMLRPDVNWTAAIIFYLLFILGLVLFVIKPSLDMQSWKNALVMGALFGLITYATFDLTNLALIKDWSLLVTIVDLCWGAFIASAVSTISYLITTKYLI
jgi:uncharacterized membrane protein